ncbi:MAG: PQQ-binding-like beta-propeller repeat protein [Planctomycetota bacterium]
MNHPRIRFGLAMSSAVLLVAGSAPAQEGGSVVDPRSESGLDHYAQGGVVLDGIAYFTSTDGTRRPGVTKSAEFPSVVAFDVNTLKTIRTYPFRETYDSSPLVIQKRDGAWLVIAHEHKNQRTVAVNRDSGKIEWTSAANQPGSMFFGYSYFNRDDGSKLILLASNNGLHALSSESGEDVWWLQRRTSGGITPCVDQKAGVIYYQCDAQVLKIQAADGRVLASADVPPPNRCVSWNTVLVNDSHGYFVATRWYGKPAWDSAIRVYDKDLKPVWEKTGLANGKKDTLTYAEGKLVTGCGNGWAKTRTEGKRVAPKPPPESRDWPPQYLAGYYDRYNWTFLYTGDAWKHITAYSIATGEVAWKCDLSKYDFGSIGNLPYFGGYLYGENGGWPPDTSKCFRINHSNGELEEVFDYGRAITSCATHIIAHGRIFSGDLWADGIVATRIAANSTADWPGPFGDPQTNQNAVGDAASAKLVPIREIRPGANE